MAGSIPGHDEFLAHPKFSSLVPIGVAVLLSLLSIFLFASVRQESGLGDETMHLFAGYEYWEHGDFGRNPEHPPFAKMLAALPLLPMQLKEPAPVPIPFFKGQDGANSSEFLYTQDANTMLMRGRMVMLLFSVCLGMLIFSAGREMFGPTIGLLALGLFVFEPVVLANGALITTDMPMTCFFFATVYAFYRYLHRRSWARLAMCAVACALTICTKHSGILIVPTLVLVALFDLFLIHPAEDDGAALDTSTVSRRAIRLAGALAVIFLFSYVILWAIYGFRYAARPGTLQMSPPLAIYAIGLSRSRHILINIAAHYHLFPEAYLYGWVDILLIPFRGSFILGRFYNYGQWFYLPVIFVIKTTLVLMVLLVLVPFARPFRRRREALFLILPAAFFAIISSSSKINLGVRHLLPVYPFCFILAAAAAIFLIRRYRFAWIGISALLLLNVVSSLHAFPDYLVYANELFGGPSHIYRVAGDSNADWGQGLKWIKGYLDHNPAPECWIASPEAPVVPAEYYGVHCKPLLSGFARLIRQPIEAMPRTISGTIFVGTTDITGFQWGPGTLNPYAAFRDGHPDAILNNEVWVYHGTYDVSLLSAQNNALIAETMLQRRQPAAALALAETAAQEYPGSASVQATLGDTLMATGRAAEGEKAMAEALRLAKANEPDYQQPLIEEIEHPVRR